MVLADGMVVVWFFGLLVLGFVGFFVAILAAILHVLRRVVRRVGRLLGLGPPLDDWGLEPAAENRARPRAGWRPDGSPAARCCPRPLCGYDNPRGARFCARCGQPLSG